ncbi:MAG: hypothetical protein ACR2H5_26165 [Ktedonobacteraceae bacterium]
MKSKHNAFKFILKWITLLIIAFVVLIAFSNGRADISALQNLRGYFPLNATTKIATVCVTSTNVQNSWMVYLHQFDQNGNQTSQQKHLVTGEQVLLQGAIVQMRYQQLMSLLNLQSGYKLTLLEGSSADEGNKKASRIPLNGGEDAEFINLQNNPSPVATASLDSPLQLKEKGKTYDLYATASGLSARPDANPPSGCSLSPNH